MPAKPCSSVIVGSCSTPMPHSSRVSQFASVEDGYSTSLLMRRFSSNDGGIARERLVMRPLTLDDLHDLALLHAQESFWHYIFRRGWSREGRRIRRSTGPQR
jgi:hypothetical protein